MQVDKSRFGARERIHVATYLHSGRRSHTQCVKLGVGRDVCGRGGRGGEERRGWITNDVTFPITVIFPTFDRRGFELSYTPPMV
jgi:hypothetical protein